MRRTGLVCGLLAGVLVLTGTARADRTTSWHRVAPQPVTADGGPECDVYFEVTDAVGIGYLKVAIETSAAEGTVHTPGPTPDCTTTVPVALLAGSPDQDPYRFGFSFSPPPAGLSGPAVIGRCGFNPDEDPAVNPVQASEFAIEVTEARDPETFALIAERPAVGVNRIECPPVTTSTTLAPTTSMLPTTTTTLGGDLCEVTVRLDEAIAVKTLALNLYYTDAAGEFIGSGSGVDCEGLVDGSIDGFNDLDALRYIATNIGHPTSYQGPADLGRCWFTPAPGAPWPVAGDFEPWVMYAGAPDGSTLDPKPAVTVSEVHCSATTVTTSTTLPQARPVCGDPTGDGLLSASDALATLAASIGLLTCQPCVCDTDDNGIVTVTDAQRTLLRAVSHPVSMVCPSCF